MLADLQILLRAQSLCYNCDGVNMPLHIDVRNLLVASQFPHCFSFEKCPGSREFHPNFGLQTNKQTNPAETWPTS